MIEKYIELLEKTDKYFNDEYDKILKQYQNGDFDLHEYLDIKDQKITEHMEHKEPLITIINRLKKIKKITNTDETI